MRLAIKYYGDRDFALKTLIEKNEGCEVVCYTDKNLSLCGSNQGGICVKTIFEVVDLYFENRCDGIVFSSKISVNMLEKMVEEAITLGINQDSCFIALPEFYTTADLNYIVQWNKYYCLPYIEFHVADHCNLNCKGCVHFSPCVNDEVFISCEEIEKDLLNLRRSVEYIENIHILGGEPLLNKQLANIVDITTKIYKFSHITVVTNGLLVKKMSSELIESIKRNRVCISISLYPPMFKKILEVIEYLKDIGIDCSYSPPLDKFSYAFNRDGGLKKDVKKLSCICPNLYHGKLYICPIIAYGTYFNSFFGSEYIDEEEGAIDITSKKDFQEIKEFLHKPVSLCDRCLYISKETEHKFFWETGRKPEKSDWII